MSDYKTMKDICRTAFQVIERLSENHGIDYMTIPTGFKTLDSATCYYPGDVIVLIGEATCKSSFLLNCAVNISKTGNPVAFLSLDKVSEVSLTVISAEGNIPLCLIKKGIISIDNWYKIIATAERLMDCPFLIKELSSSATTVDIMADIYKAKNLIPSLRIFFIDFILTSDQYELIDYLRKLKVVAAELDLVVVIATSISTVDKESPAVVERYADVLLELSTKAEPYKQEVMAYDPEDFEEDRHFFQAVGTVILRYNADLIIRNKRGPNKVTLRFDFCPPKFIEIGPKTNDFMLWNYESQGYKH